MIAYNFQDRLGLNITAIRHNTLSADPDTRAWQARDEEILRLAEQVEDLRATHGERVRVNPAAHPQHTWTFGGHAFAAADNRIAWEVDSEWWTDMNMPAGISAELLRLAQREADLVVEVKRLNRANEEAAQREVDLLTRANEALSVLQVTQPPFSEAVHVLAARAETLAVLYHTTQAARATLVDERDALVRRVDGLVLRVQKLEGQIEQLRRWNDSIAHEATEKEHQLALAKGQIESHKEVHRADASILDRAFKDLAASESRGRRYCVELAEKAEEIRGLELSRELWKRSAENMGQMVLRLESAIQAALGHVAEARTYSVNNLAPSPWSRRMTELLDLAREALAGAGRQREQADADALPGSSANGITRKHVEALEQTLRHLDDPDASGHRGYYARGGWAGSALHSLLGWLKFCLERGALGVERAGKTPGLDDIAEGADMAEVRRVLHEHDRRLSALEAGKG